VYQALLTTLMPFIILEIGSIQSMSLIGGCGLAQGFWGDGNAPSGSSSGMLVDGHGTN